MVVQWSRLCLSMQGVWVPSLVSELRSHMSQGKKKEQKQNYNKFKCKDFLKMVHIKKINLKIRVIMRVKLD